jgi:type III restriction enzyme
MSSAIDHLIINSPYEEPKEYWRYIPESKSFKRETGRRSAGYITASSTKKVVDDPGVFVEIQLVNRIRARVKAWRDGDEAQGIAPYAGTTGITKRLLEHWHNLEEREVNRFFFCQLEAIETLIWLAEAPDAQHVGIEIPSDGGEFLRLCCKMATGSGKTIVMAMLIAWQALNKVTYAEKTWCAKNFLVIAPGLTVKSRLSVLVPSADDNYYDAFNIVPTGLREKLRQATVIVRNWHALNWESDAKIARRKSVDKRGAKSDEAYAREVLGEMANARNFVVINDEAHHAWRIPQGTKIKGLSKSEAEEATKWIGGLDRLNNARGVLTAFDFSATPFTPSGKTNVEEDLFGWIVSDFGLNDAIESGLVKTPRVVVRDDGRPGLKDYKSQFYHLYTVPQIKESLNHRDAKETDPLPDLLRNAYEILGADWLATAKEWKAKQSSVPPVMITVANRTETAARIKYAFDHKRLDILELCNPEKTLHIDSKVLEMAEAIADEAEAEPINETDAETSADEENGADEPTRKLSKKEQAQQLRLTVDTVGKVGGLGEQIQHVISVGMLTEGWDAKTVTHIMGLRAFSSQLLCEQVVGRGLRRTAYDINEHGMFEPEYVNIFGVPFTFLPHETPKGTAPPPPSSRVRIEPLRGREEFAISWPNVIRIEHVYKPKLRLDLNHVEPLTLSAYDTPRLAELAPILDGRPDFDRLSAIDLEKLRGEIRLQRSIFDAALTVYEQMKPSWKGGVNSLFTQLVPLVESFIRSDNLQISPPLFGLDETKRRILIRLNAVRLVNHIFSAIQEENTQSLALVVDRDYPILSTGDMKPWDTSKPVAHTKKSHINFCVCDSGWEQHAALSFDRADSITAWVKNDHLSFEIRYIFNGREHKYRPDFLIRFQSSEILALEVKGEETQQDRVKRDAVREWVKAVNAHGGFGKWLVPVVAKHPDDIAEILHKVAM